jgi:gamma-glutamylcysteine synthetase
MATKSDKAEIDPSAHYEVKTKGVFTFRGVDFTPLAKIELSGEFLATLLASDKAEFATSYDKV